MRLRATLLALGLSTVVLAIAGIASAGSPTFVTTTVDDTTFLSGTSAICGFPVYEHDVGTVTTMVTTLPDGSVKSQDIVVQITTTFYSTEPAHTGTAVTRPSGPFIEIDHPDGSVTMWGIGQNGHVNIPGSGIVWASSGITKIEIDPSGNVTEVAHGNMSPDHSGICPLL
jgi:hypothetical protein